jgi:AAA family ATP:ADP antiporter
MLVPLIIGALLLFFMLTMTSWALVVVFIGMKAIHYAFSSPVRESLYIPTVKEIKFKSKSWIDAFGSKFAKSSGNVYNMASARVVESQLLAVHSFFFAGVVAIWFVAAYMLGKRYEWAVENNEVIGLDQQDAASEKA